MTTEPDTRIRNAPRALIIRDDRILLLRKRDEIKGCLLYTSDAADDLVSV